MATSSSDRVAMLWQLAFQDDRLSCAVYRCGSELRLQVESAKAVIVSEQFDFEPRALARAQALRAALKRRGWEDS